MSMITRLGGLLFGAWGLMTGQGTSMANPLYFSGRDIPLQHAVDADDPQAVALALRAGADVNARERQVGATILEYAVAQLRNRAIAALLEHGADPALRDRANANAVTIAADAWFRDPTPLRLLLDAGADPNTRDEEGEPILESFLTLKQVDAIDCLFQHHADVNILTAGDYDPKSKDPNPTSPNVPDGRPVILSQAGSDDWDMVYKLLQQGAKFDYPDSPASITRWYDPRYENIPGVGSEMYTYKVKCWKFMTERGLKLPPFAGMTPPTPDPHP